MKSPIASGEAKPFWPKKHAQKRNNLVARFFKKLDNLFARTFRLYVFI